MNILRGDCLVWLSDMGSNSVDAIVTDPPYELGFMGKKWDNTGIAYSPKLWSALLRILRPGGHLLAFGGTRTYHRMACAIEDAGFEVRDSLHWMYGTGFPKSLTSKSAEIPDWAGTALKPGHEPIVMARKPLDGTVAENLAKWGTGVLNIDGCRIGRAAGDVSGWSKTGSGESENRAMSGKNYGRKPKPDASGRFPANVLLDEAAASELDAQSGTLKGGLAVNRNRKDRQGGSRFFYVAKPSRAERDLGCEDMAPKSGGEATDREDDSAGTQSPRAGAGRKGGARNHHPTVKPVALMRYLVRLVTPPGGLVLDPFLGSGTTGMAAVLEGFRFVGIEREEEYAEIAQRRIESVRGERK